MCGLRDWPVRTAPHQRIAAPSTATQAVLVSDPLIERSEVVALLFNVSDIAVTLTKIEQLWEGTMAKKKLTKAERAERDARHERVLANARRTRELAERAQAKLEAQRPPE
jgi:hypothetical protein